MINTVEEHNPMLINDYLETASGKKYNANNLKIYRVKYEIKYLNDEISPEKNGIHTKYYFLVRNNSSSEWLIDDWGN